MLAMQTPIILRGSLASRMAKTVNAGDVGEATLAFIALAPSPGLINKVKPPSIAPLRL
jgi:hypothetical protein